MNSGFISKLYSDIPLGWEPFFEEVSKELLHIESKIGLNYGPDDSDMFKIFYACRPDNIKVFILGDKPSHDCNFSSTGRVFYDQGIAFSQFDFLTVSRDNLRIIENLHHHGYPRVNNGCKLEWVAQGVFLINRALTFDSVKFSPHYNLWKCFIIKLLRFILKMNEGIVFVFFQFDTSDYEDVILNKGVILKEISPYSNRFKKEDLLFLKINAVLRGQGKKVIEWATSNV